MKTGDTLKKCAAVWMLWNKDKDEFLGPFATREEARGHKLSTDRLVRANVASWVLAK